MRIKVDVDLDYHFPQPAEVLLALEVAQMADQRLISDCLTVSSGSPLVPLAGQDAVGQRTWAGLEGRCVINYRAEVEIERAVPDIGGLAAAPLRDLPSSAVQYLWPSRYCQSEQLDEFALAQFGTLKGGAAVLAMAEWIKGNVTYQPGCSDAATTASDTFQKKKGICRDFAHVLISFARALDLPARMVSAYAWKLDPPDFHAVVEIYLEGGWYLIDPTGLAPVETMARIAVGRDATDVSFMTIFGVAELNSQSVRVERIV